jgi:hypothetical protein
MLTKKSIVLTFKRFIDPLLASSDLSQVDPDHYLFGFTNEELLALLAVPDEWSEFDYQLAIIILKDRGHEVSPEIVDELRQDRLRELAKPDTKNRVWIVIGYLLAAMGGLLGIIIRWHLATFKKTLPNGERVYDYSPRAREHGQRIGLMGTVMFVGIALWRIFALE